MLALRAERLIDGTGRDPLRRAVVLVDGGRITEVGAADEVPTPPGAEVIDLGDRTLIPGLVDAHTHFGAGLGAGPVSSSNYDVLLRAAAHARTDLLSGVTTARTLSERDFMDVAYREAIAKGWIAGPRVVVAGRGLQPRDLSLAVSDLQVDGPAAIRSAVRQNVERGADWIKLFLNPSFRGPTPTKPSFPRAVIEAAVDEAHAAGKRVAAHVLGGMAVDDALEAGVDTFEHGIYMTDAQLEELARRGKWLVITQSLRLWGDDPAVQPDDPVRAAFLRIPRAARKAGVNIALGTDTGHGLLHFEIACLVRAGYPAMEAILAATRRAAEALGLASEVGTIEPGKRADLVAVPGDPLRDIGRLHEVEFVMKEGVIQRG